MRGCGQLWKQMGLLPEPPPPPPTSRQDEPEGHAVVLQLAEHAPPGQPVGIPNTVSAMQKPLVGGRHCVSVVHALPTCEGPASGEVQAPEEHVSPLKHVALVSAQTAGEVALRLERHAEVVAAAARAGRR